MAGPGLTSGVAVAETLIALRARLVALADSLTSGGRLNARAGQLAFRETAHEEMDRIVLDARHAESQLVRRVDGMDRETQRLIASLQQQRGMASRSGWRERLGFRRPKDTEPDTDRRALIVLVDLVRESDIMLGALEDHRAALRALLVEGEQALDEALVRIGALESRPEGDQLADHLQPGVDLLQELIDRLIGLIQAASLLINKLSIDAEERVIALSGLAFVLAEAEESVPRLAPLFRRAERGLLSMRGLAARKERINEAFLFRLNASRQAASG